MDKQVYNKEKNGRIVSKTSESDFDAVKGENTEEGQNKLGFVWNLKKIKKVKELITF